MLLDLKPLFTTDDATLQLEKSFDFSDIELGGTCPVQRPVKLSGTIENRAGVVAMKAQLRYIYSAPCDRCAQPVDHAIAEELFHVFVTDSTQEETEEMVLVPDMQLDLLELVRMDFLLSLPTKHLCSEDCKGLCMDCGQNLNDASCTCNLTKVDPRLEKLKSLLD